jgi:hypothetical protein
MPNGFHGSNEDWARLAAPLLTLDPAFEAFARQHGFTISRNDHNWPERSVRWGSGIERLIQVYLADEQRLLFTLWLCAFEDRAKGRYWKHRNVYSNTTVAAIGQNLEKVLEESKSEVDAWSANDLGGP